MDAKEIGRRRFMRGVAKAEADAATFHSSNGLDEMVLWAYRKHGENV